MTKVREIMTKEFKFIEPTMMVQEAAQLMNELNIGFLPVREDNKLIGTITDRDITIRCTAQGYEPSKTPVSKVMTPKCLYCYADSEVEELAMNMGKNQIRRLPVLNEEKELVGVVSLGDFVFKGSKYCASEALYGISQKAH